MSNKILNAEDRKLSGRKVKVLRFKGILPGNVYGKKIKSAAVQIQLKEFLSLYKEVGETGLIDLKVGDTTRPVLVHGIQYNPKTGECLHVDFFQVDLKSKVSAQVPIELVGESPAAKQGMGNVVQQVNEVEVEALPADLPDGFEVNIDNLVEVDQAFYVRDIVVDKNIIEIKSDPELIIVKVEPLQKEEISDTPIVAVGAEGEVPTEDTSSVENKSEEKNTPKEE